MTKADLEEINATFEKDIIFLKEQIEVEPNYEKVTKYEMRLFRAEHEELQTAKQDISDLKDVIIESQKTVYELAKALITLINQKA